MSLMEKTGNLFWLLKVHQIGMFLEPFFYFELSTFIHPCLQINVMRAMQFACHLVLYIGIGANRIMGATQYALIGHLRFGTAIFVISFNLHLTLSCFKQAYSGDANTVGIYLMVRRGWWSQTGSNRRPHACKARALPAELWP